MSKKTTPVPIYRGDELAGHLVYDNGGNLIFIYDKNCKTPISPTLPLDGSGSPPHVYAWFRELIPDERRRKAFESMTRFSLQRVGKFLAWFGEDLPGNLSVKPASQKNEPQDITHLITLTVGVGGSIDRATMGTSLGGCDPKVAVIPKEENGELLFLSASSSDPSTHILKSAGLAAAIEDVSTQLAKDINMFPVSQMRPVAIRNLPCLLIERFDRYKDPNGKTQKLAQEDFCQAIGTLQRRGSEDGGISMQHIVNVIKERLDKNALRQFLAMFFFSMFIGNSDDHAGNYALLQNAKGEWGLAPAYDLISVAAFKQALDNSRLGVRSMIGGLPLEQPRKFGEHYDALEIDSEDVAIVEKICEIDRTEIGQIAMECHDRILDCLNSDFTARNHERWDALNLDSDFQKLATASINAFSEIVPQRVEELGNVFRNVFRTAFDINQSTIHNMYM